MHKTLAALIFIASIFAAPSVFAAGECDTDTDCESYETCEVVGEQTCACAPGDAGCECPDAGSEEYRECVPEPPASCDTDADCTGDLRCVTQTYEECTGSGSAGVCRTSPDGGTECEDAGTTDITESCETITEGYCVPSYIGPCDQDADCGDGFTCEPYEVCECTGGGSVGSGGDGDGSADAGATDAAPSDSGDSCTCETEGSYCELVETECTSDADCTGDLTCQTYDEATVTEPCIDDGDASSCTSADAGSTSTKYCLPPDWERWADVSGDLGGSSRDEIGGDGSNEAADAGQTSSDADDDNGGSGSNSEGGCSTTGGETPLGGLALVLIGLWGLAIRRR